MAIRNETLKALRKDRGWTQQQLADTAGIAQGTYSRIERGESVSSQANTMTAIERALGVPPGTLTSDAPDDPETAVQTTTHSDAAPTVGGRADFDRVAEDLLAETPEEARSTTRVMIEKIRRSGSMQNLDLPLTVATLADLVKVISRHTLRRDR